MKEVMLSNTKTIILILACLGFLFWDLYGRQKDSPEKEEVPVQEVQQPTDVQPGKPAGQPVSKTAETEKKPSARVKEWPIRTKPEETADQPTTVTAQTRSTIQLKFKKRPDTVKTEESVQRQTGKPAETEKRDPMIEKKSKPTVMPQSGTQTTDDSPDSATWASFREKRFPAYVEKLQAIFQYAVTLEVAWGSLGNLAQHPRLEESLEYDLNALIKAFQDPWKPDADPQSKVDKAKIRQGIGKISLRRVKGLENRRLEVTDNVMQMDFSWERHGRFSSRDIEILLLDRDRAQISQWINTPQTELSPLMWEACRNRLPVLFKDLDMALGHPIPVQIDWPSIHSAPDATYRLEYLMSTLNRTLRELAKTDLGFGPRSTRERRLEQQLAEERSAIVKDQTKAIRIRGGSYTADALIRFKTGSLELVVFQDEAYIRKSDTGQRQNKPVTDIQRFPDCSSKGMKTLITKELDLEVGPFLRQVKAVHFPMAQAYLPVFLDQLIAKTRLKVSERAELRDFLTSHDITLEVDWDSLLSPEETADRITVLSILKTGDYNYNDKYGELFRNFFHAAGEAVRKDPDFLKSFILLVREVRYEQVSDPAAKALITEGSTLVIRQCLYKRGGLLDYQVLADKMTVAVAAMTHAPGKEQMETFTDLDTCLAGLEETMHAAGMDVGLTVDDAMTATAESVRETCKRMLIPLNGAIRWLLKQPDYLTVFNKQVNTIQITRGTAEDPKGCRYHHGDLHIWGLPGSGMEGWLAGDELASAIDHALALNNRAKILELEIQRGPKRVDSLRERFGWDVELTVDWEAFLAHAEQGDYPLIPITVEQYATERMVYALVEWMEDESYREKTSQRIHGIRIASAPDMASRKVYMEGDAIVYECFAGPGYVGYLLRDEIQQRLYSLIIKEK